jgi:hypothetical protein
METQAMSGKRTTIRIPRSIRPQKVSKTAFAIFPPGPANTVEGRRRQNVKIEANFMEARSSYGVICFKAICGYDL